jgi:amicyanin
MPINKLGGGAMWQLKFRKVSAPITLAALVLFLLLALSCAAQTTTPTTPPKSDQPQIHNVEIKNFGFSPPELRIKKGDTVVWVNRDSAGHTVTSDSSNELGSPQISQNQEYRHTFTQSGTFNYHCTLHPSMKAKVMAE